MKDDNVDNLFGIGSALNPWFDRFKEWDSLGKIGREATLSALASKSSLVSTFKPTTLGFNIEDIMGPFHKQGNSLNFLNNASFGIRVQMAKPSSWIDAVLGGTTRSDISALAAKDLYPSKLNTDIFKSISPILEMQDTVVRNLDVYKQQVSISELLATNLTATIPNSIGLADIFSVKNFEEKRGLSGFDILSGSSFYKTFTHFNNQTKEVSLAYSQVSELLNNKELADDILKFQATASAIQAEEKGSKDKTYKILDTKYFTELFLTEIIKKYKIPPRLATIIVSLAYHALIYCTVKYGASVYDLVIHDKQKGEEKGKAFLDHILKPRDLMDFVVKKTPIYLRNSTKTCRIGHVQKGTYLFIIKIREGWCYVEGRVRIDLKNNRKNKKKFKTCPPYWEKESVRGWIQTKYMNLYNE